MPKVLLALFASGLGVAHAHFALLQPASALSDESGGKGAPPCAEGIASNIVTAVQGGHPLHIRLTEFVFHPGHYRIALSVNSRAQLPPDPSVLSDSGVSVSAAIQNPPKIPVLADGVFPHTDPPTGDWQTDIVLPNLTCDKCTLQIIEFMAEHGFNPGGGFFYHHCADLKITVDPALPPADPAWSRLRGGPTAGVFPHLTDGGGWQTSMTLVNLDTVPASFRVQFWSDNGGALPLPGLGNVSSVSGTIPVGGSQTIHTDRSPPAAFNGWAQVSSPQWIDGTAVLHWSATGWEAAERLQNAPSAHLFFPFDNSNGAATGIALTAPGVAASISDSLTLRNQQGLKISAEAPDSVPANGHTAFVLPMRPAQPADLLGVANFLAANASLIGVGIRASQNFLTSIEPVIPDVPSTKIAPHITDGVLGKTRIVLINCDFLPTAYQLNLWNDNGTPLPALGGTQQATISGTIPAGGSQTIETSGLPVDTTGWAEVLSSQCVGGTVLLPAGSGDQQVAVPLLSTGGRSLVLPFDVTPGLALGIALANPSLTLDAEISVTVRDEGGAVLSTPPPIDLPPRQHSSFVLPIPPGGSRGTVEFDSPNVDIFAIGIRSNNGALSAIQAMAK